jgi:hypothetical protein
MKDWKYFLDGDCGSVALVVMAARLLFKKLEETLMELCYRVSCISICHCILFIGPRRQKWAPTRVSGMSNRRHGKPTCRVDKGEKDVQRLLWLYVVDFIALGRRNGVVAGWWLCR